MSLKVFNTITSRKEDFNPIDGKNVGMYVCGVTVYDMCHIGHARAYVSFDVIQRYLRYSGYNLKTVRNFTDVDDKIIKRAQEQGEPPNAISERYIKEFSKDMELLGVAPSDVEPKVTEHIPEIIDLIKRIIDRGHAYEADGDIYFSVKSFPSYLQLSGRQLEDMKAGARVEVDGKKSHPMDFALWKSSKPGEPWWDSPWGKGRPGWHIECSAMSMKYLGETFDIHGGGKDLIFPHHENEIAQSEGATGKKFVNYWIHNGFVNINDEKMSKSLGNFFTIREITARYHPEALRFFMLTTHYRSPINFSEQSLEESQKRVEYAYQSLEKSGESLQGKESDEGKLMNAEMIEKIIPLFREAMDDDFNAARTLGDLSEAIRFLNELAAGKAGGSPKDRKKTILALRKNILEVASVLGILQRDPATVLREIRDRKVALKKIDSTVVEELILKRVEARKAKDFAGADSIRDELTKMGVSVMDSKTGTTWRID